MQKRKYFLGVTLVLTFGMIGYFSMKRRGDRVVSLVSPIVEVATISMPPKATPTAATTASETAVLAITSTSATSPATLKTLPTPTLTTTPSPANSKDVNEYIDRFSSQFGIDPNVLRYVAICESGFRSNVTNGPYVGLFQFDSGTWKNIRKEIGEDTNPTLRFEAKDAVQTAAYAISKGKTKLWPNCVP